jgi:hypothetical protein
MTEYAEFADDEVMTYAPVRNLGAEVAELEAQRRQLQRDNAELREKLDAVPVEELRRWFLHSSVGAEVDAMRYDRDIAWSDHDTISDWFPPEPKAVSGVPGGTNASV